MMKSPTSFSQRKIIDIWIVSFFKRDRSRGSVTKHVTIHMKQITVGTTSNLSKTFSIVMKFSLYVKLFANVK